MKPASTRQWFGLLAIPVGLAAGWLASPFVLPAETTEAPPSPSPRTAEKRTARPFSTPAATSGSGLLADLNSVDACRQSLADLEDVEGFHPLAVSALRDRALRAWLDLDAADALAHAESNVVHLDGGFAGDLFRVWIDLDVNGAIEAFSLASPAMVNSTYSAFFLELARHDPELTLDTLAQARWDLGEDNKYARQEVLRRAYTIMAERDPGAALARYQIDKENLVFNKGYGNPGIGPILEAWAKSDAQAAWEYVKTNGEENDLHYIASHLLLDHPEIAGQFDNHEVYYICEELVQRDLAAALRLAESRPEDDLFRRDILATAARYIATADPERAIQLYAESGGSSKDYLDEGIFRQAFITLNSQDPERAMALLAGVSKEMRAAALGGILTHEFASGHEDACARCRVLLDNPETRDLVAPALEEALSWGHGSGNHDLSLVAEKLPEVRSEIRGYLLESWVRTAPEAAAAFIADEAIRLAPSGEDFFDDEDENSDMTHEAISELAFSRPEFTAEWVSTLPEGRLRTHVAESLATNWARFDRAAAQAWVESLPEGTMKENAAKKLTAPHEKKSPW